MLRELDKNAKTKEPCSYQKSTQAGINTENC